MTLAITVQLAAAAACVYAAHRFWRWLHAAEPAPRFLGENVIEFEPRATRTGRPVPPAIPRGPRRRGDAA